ncbi:phosphatidylinositol mannoside acyltransferase [Streptomyces sp. AJS327]|uniref:phosphatidylinositol mannoside acyltransferase n=1 Tax=Streptomyces sp. AJS327 TaxID=2545265 RepID=UPI0015DE02EF|nr:phosphatidylinositol mannoside acyltransferase [Streptomyces sp. AJS327]MBA0050785.1 phosphatidylinositol mannoside acyltransferase [Streptomyces sp. AJS327]
MSALGDRLSGSLYGLGWGGVKKLPEPAAEALGRRVADAAWRRRGAGVRQLEANLARVEPGASVERLRALSRAGMRSYLRYWMESFRLPVWTPEQISERAHILGEERLRADIASPRGVVLALPHLANWDLAGAWLTTHLGAPFTTVAERLRPESLYDRFVAYREGLGMEVLPHAGASAYGQLAQRLRAGGVVCLVADRDLSPSSGVEVDFFGETARMPAGPARLALQTGAMLLPVTLWYGPARQMWVRVHPEIEPPETGGRREQAAAMTQRLADVFAGGIAEHPEDWHMLQRLWLADLPERRPTAPGPSEAAGADPAGRPAEADRADGGGVERARRGGAGDGAGEPV